MGNTSRERKRGTDLQIVTALKEGLLQLDLLPLGGRVFTQAELAAFLETRTTKAQAVVTSKKAWHVAIDDFDAHDALAEIVVRDLRNVVIGACGETHPTVSRFGFAARKKPVLTPEQKELANQRRKATRAKRKTMGRKQKLAIKGVVPDAAGAAPVPETPGSGSGLVAR
jgi:hypothetical protein